MTGKPENDNRQLMKNALMELEKMRSRLKVLESREKERAAPIAIVGAGCRFPHGANDLSAFWELLHRGEDAISEVPSKRWPSNEYYDSDRNAKGKMYTRNGGFLDEVDGFDAGFFGISAREAALMDPQQRLLLEVSWEAMESAGITSTRLNGSKTGVFVGVMNLDYLLISPGFSDFDIHTATGNAKSVIAGRLAYILGLRGPAMAVDTACSSSLVSVHLACQSLRQGECDLAFAGGVNLILSPAVSIAECRAQMLSPDGRSKTFDAAADGYGRGEGCGIILLKRLSDALKDGDTVLGLIRGSAINHDGASSGLTVPNEVAQEEVMEQALANAGVDADQVDYLEAHGTGTPLGDPIEISAIHTVYGKKRSLENPLYVGSVKTNMGHLEGAAGIVALIKTLLSLQRGEIPASLHYDTPNPRIDWENIPIRVPVRPTLWPSNGGDKKRRIAAISSFGFSGTNAHLLLEQAPAREEGEQGARQWGERKNILTLSAKNAKALTELAARYRDYLSCRPDILLGDACFTANTARTHFEYRAAVAGEFREEFCKKLDEISQGGAGELRPVSPRPKIAFLFTGQGSQYTGMGWELFVTEPVFCEAMKRCDTLLRPYMDKPLLDILYPDTFKQAVAEKRPHSGADDPIHETAYTQPAIFALEYSLAALWKSWGVEPSVVMGHSVGENVAAHLAGVFSLEDALKMVASRGRLMQGLPKNGKMVVVLAGEKQVLEAIGEETGRVSIAAINGPQSVVVSGDDAAIARVVATLQKARIMVSGLKVSHASHSPLMRPILEDFRSIAKEIAYASPRIKFVSNLPGKLVTEALASPDFWVDHIEQPVRFAEGMAALQREGCELFLEIGPGSTSLGMGRQCLPDGYGRWLPSIREGIPELRQMCESLVGLYQEGIEVDWKNFYQNVSMQRVPLPNYPFQRKRHWLPEKNVDPAKDYEDWFYETAWKESPFPDNASSRIGSGRWVIFADAGGLGRNLAEGLRVSGASCVTVARAQATARTGENTFGIDPEAPGAFDALYKILAPQGEALEGIVFLWGLDATSTDHTLATLEAEVRNSLHGSLRIVQSFAGEGRGPRPRIWLVTQGAVSVRDEIADVAVSQSPLWGFARVLPVEHPELWGGIVDLDPMSSTSESVDQLLLSFACRNRDDRIAFRNGTRYVERMVRGSSGKSVVAPAISFRSDSAYVITGGLGGMGLKTALWMQERGARNFILVGRSQLLGREEWETLAPDHPQSEAVTAIRQIETGGAKVVLATLDIADEIRAERFFRDYAESGKPPIRGVIHAAGSWSDKALANMSSEELDSVLRPKVAGTWALHRLSQGWNLDFFILYSSFSSFLASHGQANYAAANAFLDAVAGLRAKKGLPCLSINWGPWSEVGFGATRDGERAHKRMESFGIGRISPRQGLSILGHLISRKKTQCGVVPIDWERIARNDLLLASAPYLEEVLGTESAVDLFDAEPTARTDFLSGKNSDEQKISLVEMMCEIVAGVLFLQAEEIGSSTPLNTLGMDSLMALEIRNRIRVKIGVNVTVLDILGQENNAENLALCILAELKAKSLAGEQEASRSTAREEFTI